MSITEAEHWHLSCMSFKLPFVQWEFILCLTTENSIIQQQDEKVGIWGIHESCTRFQCHTALKWNSTVKIQFHTHNLWTTHLSAINMQVTHVLLYMTAYPLQFMVSDQIPCTSFIIFSSIHFY
jgi:hypothetical protein